MELMRWGGAGRVLRQPLAIARRVLRLFDVWPPTVHAHFLARNFTMTCIAWHHGRPAAALRPRLLLSRTSTRGSAEGGERRRISR